MAVVLVVNDDPDMLDLYAAVLEDMGHHAVVRVEADPEPDTVLEAGADAVVIDLQAEADPVAGMRAIEVLRSSPATQAIPIILATAASPREMQPIAGRLEELRVPVLRKPFGVDRFQNLIGRLLPGRHPQPGDGN
jgi:CheY-like chemotaxis protein